jgi:putative molybdopterin biosynthesis protein
MIGGQYQIIRAAVPWQHIRSVGEDMVEQDMIVPSRTLIGPYELASFKTASVERVPVIKRPVVAIIPTGTELVERGYDDMPPGEIVESNSRMLAALCEQWGGVALRHDIVIDDKELIRQAVVEMEPQADMIVICSGSSAGREDYTASIVEELGRLIVHGIATRPGKPAILGTINRKPVIGVPGYPVSAQLIFSLFAQPIIYARSGGEMPSPDTIQCQVARKLPSHAGVDEYVNVNVAKISDHFLAYPLNRGAGVTSMLVKSDGVLHIPRGSEGLDAGSPCTVALCRPRPVIENTLVCLGSHDLAIDVLIDILQKDHGIRMISTNVGSMGGIVSLSRGETHCAGLHLLDYESGDYNTSYLKKYLGRQKVMLVNLVNRDQGLVVQKGNPLEITGIEDLLRPEVRYINRQKGAGTRLLLDYLLQKKNIDNSGINGYNREEYSHLAVAASIKNNAGDAGMAIYASARILDLDFVPVETERYDLCILPDLFTGRQLDSLLTAINSNEFKRRMQSLGGYHLENTGLIIQDGVG